MTALYHVRNVTVADALARESPGCGQPALYLRRRVDPLQTLAADNVVLLSGARPQRGEAIVCGSCGATVHPALLSYWPLPC
jgi:hypothetical protein